MGDNTEGRLIRQVARFAAEAMMPMLLGQVRGQTVRAADALDTAAS